MRMIKHQLTIFERKMLIDCGYKKGVNEFISNMSNKTKNGKFKRSKIWCIFNETSVLSKICRQVIATQYLIEYLVPALDVNIREQKFHLLLVIYLGVKVF